MLGTRANRKLADPDDTLVKTESRSIAETMIASSLPGVSTRSANRFWPLPVASRSGRASLMRDCVAVPGVTVERTWMK